MDTSKELFSPAESGPSEQDTSQRRDETTATSAPAIAAPATSEPGTAVQIEGGDSMEGVEETSATQAAPTAPTAPTVINLEQTPDADKAMPPPPPPAPKKTKLSFVEHLKSPIVTLLVGSPPAETTLTAHQSLLTTSPFFADLCNSVPSGTQGFEIELPDDELEPMGCFLQYLYTGDYFPRIIAGAHGEGALEEDEELEESTSRDEDGRQLLKHAKVYTLAEKLQLPELKTLAHNKIHMINSTAVGELSYAKYVYANTPEDDVIIRGPIATFWAHKSYALRHEAKEQFESMILQYPRFALDMINILLDQKEREKNRERESRAERASQDTPRSSSKLAGRKRPRVSSVNV